MSRPKLTDRSEGAGPSGGEEASAGLKQSEARFRASFENAAVGIAHVAPDGSWQRVNQRLCELTGYTADELLARTLEDITHRGELDAGLAQLRRMRDGGIDTYNSEKRYVRKDGSAIWIRLAASAVRKADGAAEFFNLVFEDISEQKRAETALRESEEKFRGIFEHAPIGIAITDLKGRFQSCNRPYSDMLGYTEEELRTLDFSCLLHSGDREENLMETSRLLAQQVPSFEIINRYIARDGDPIRVHKHVSLLRNSAGEPTGMIALVTDVTQVHRAEVCRHEQERHDRFLLELEKRLQSFGTAGEAARLTCQALGKELGAAVVLLAELQPGSEDAVVECIWTDHGDTAHVPQRCRAADLFGRRTAALLAGEAVRARDVAIETSAGASEETRAAFASLGIRSSIGLPLAADGNPPGFLLVADTGPRDWTEAEAELARDAMKCSQQAVEKVQANVLRESEERLRHLGDSLPDNAVYRYAHEADGTPRFLYISAGIEQLNGVRAEDVLDDAGVFHRQVLAGHLPKLAEAERRSARELSDLRIELPMRRPDGEVRWMRLQSRPQRLDDGRVIWDGVQTDITERKQAEEALRESEERLRLSNAAAGIGTFTVDLETKCAHYSPETAAIVGFPEVRIAPVEAAIARVHRDDAAWVRKQCEEAANGANGGQVKMDFRFVRPGGEVRWMTWMGRTDFREDQSGRIPFRILGCCLDITERKHAEEALRESEERLRLSNEAAGIGTFTIDLETKCAHYSPETAAILGFPDVRTAPVEAAIARVHRDDAPWVRKQYEEAANGTNGGQVKMDFRFVRPGGEVRWMTWMGRTDFREDQSGRRPFRIIGCCLDITERKRREEQVDFLMREVNHRSKNMLALVLSVARQTRAINRDDFISCFEERIQALAANQDLLVKNLWKGVNLDQLIRSQLAHFSGLIGTRIELRGAPLLISASAAQTIGMVLHELATNAGKYGALSNSSGRVEVEWATGGPSSGKETFEMSWRECGGPPVEAPKKQGFGTVVVCGMAEMSLNAKVDFSFAADGLSWQLRCSAREILEAN